MEKRHNGFGRVVKLCARTQVLLLMLCIVPQWVFAQPTAFHRKDAVDIDSSAAPEMLAGIGYLENSELGGDFILQVEYSIARKLSINASAGCFPWNRYSSRSGSFFSLFFGLESRYYYALRRRYFLSGLFVGPAIGYNWSRSGYNSITNQRADVSWKHLGLTLGYQHRWGDRFAMAAKIVAGYPHDILVEAHDRQNHLVYRNKYSTLLVGYAGLSFGYVF